MHMDCAQFEELVHDLDRPRTPAALRESALAHAERCARCAWLMTETEALDFSLRGLAGEDIGLEASPRLEEALLSEFRRKKAAASRRRIAWQLVALGAAAAIALAVGISLRHRLAPVVKSAGTEQAVTVRPSASQGSVAQTAEQPAAMQAGDSEYATEFVPLPYADDSAMADGGAVVRVVLSRSALASLGVPVADAGDTSSIPADLVVSEDGTPQAIRLVSQASVN